MSSQASVSTLAGDEQTSKRAIITLDLNELPPVFVIPAHLGMVELHELEDQLREGGAPLTYDPLEARIFLGRIAQKRRAVMELRSREVFSQEVALEGMFNGREGDTRPAKRRRTEESASSRQKEILKDDSSTESEPDVEACAAIGAVTHPKTVSTASENIKTGPLQPLADENTICVLKVEWFDDSIKEEHLLPLDKYLVYLGRRSAKPEITITNTTSTLSSPRRETARVQSSSTTAPNRQSAISGQDILERARAEAPSQRTEPARSFASTSQFSKRTAAHSSGRIAHLTHETTSEHDHGCSQDLPEMPDWVKRRSTFSCERSTPIHGPNDDFVEQLKKIRLARTLIADEIGVRAYSTSIAAIAAYPYTITDQREILALPGCDSKISALWVEWKNKNGFIQAVQDAEDDDTMKVLRLFYEIWGVGSHTAQEFHNKGWRDLDDIVEYGWNELSRVQQIGVKYYDEFLEKLSRSEVEFIGRKIHEHAQRVREPTGVRTCIVGGHRRGKKESGDVDIIVSHLDEDETLNIVEDIVKSLSDEGWVTHELITHMSASRRSQATLPYRSGGGGHGFDTLDKALVVWQDPEWPGRNDKDEDGSGARKKNPNVHRRVDIIIAPWSKVGCAVLGWSAGMTFERDLRRYARKVKGWKFDSSGVRDRNTGQEMVLEGVGGRCTSLEEAERKVFKGFGLEWREPWERNTG